METRSFVGFGFGPIQLGLMIYEAQRSGNFGSYVIAEIDQQLVDAVRTNGDSVYVNIARADGISSEPLAGVQLFNPTVRDDRERIADAVRTADELATAIPSVDLYDAGTDASVPALLAANIRPDKPRVLYASENHNDAAGLLKAAVLRHTRLDTMERFQILNTVIGKMSGVVRDADTIKRLGLATLTPDLPHSVLVEAFSAIQISAIKLENFTRGITVFEEKHDLLPFEEAKLYGHNAIHAMLGYLAAERGCTVMSEIADHPELMDLGRRAFIDEGGRALIEKHGETGDRLFTDAGFRTYAEDLLQRMTNPYLNDAVERVCRDPVRKLRYDDRIFGAMRSALESGIRPLCLARGAHAALRYCAMRHIDLGIDLSSPAKLDAPAIRTVLNRLWHDDNPDQHQNEIIELVGLSAE